MTNGCYSYRVYNMYLGTDPVKLNQQFYSRKRIRNRLFYRLFRGRMYWGALDVLHKIHEIYTIVIRKIHRMEGRAQYRIHRIVRFAYELVMAILRLNAPIQVAFMVALTVLDGCALIAIL